MLKAPRYPIDLVPPSARWSPVEGSPKPGNRRSLLVGDVADRRRKNETQPLRLRFRLSCLNDIIIHASRGKATVKERSALGIPTTFETVTVAKLNPDKVPRPLVHLIPMAEKWALNGGYSDGVRNASSEELEALVHCIDDVADDYLYGRLAGP